MIRTAHALLDEARKLSPEDRAMVAERLLETLDQANDVDVDAAWAATAEDRAAEAELDPMVLIDWADAKAEIERDVLRK